MSWVSPWPYSVGSIIMPKSQKRKLKFGAAVRPASTQLVSRRASTQTQAWLTPESVFTAASQHTTTGIVILGKWTRDKIKGPGSPGPGLDHKWQRGAERIHFFFSEPAYGRKGENQNAKELKCLHQTILATQCMVPNQQHKHLQAAGETCKSQVLPRLSQNLHSGRSPGDPHALKNFKGHCSRGFIESSGWEVSRTNPECWLWNHLSL